jgi:Rieske Fe-S protein
MGPCSRRRFHALVLAGAGSAWLRCGSGPGDGSVTPVMNEVTLPFARFPRLESAGGSVVVGVTDRFPLAVVRTSATAATALSATCTHAGCLVEYSAARGNLHCPCHDADFALDGQVQGGPTIIPLPVYAARITADAIIVDLS